MYQTDHSVKFFFDGVNVAIDTHGGAEKRVPNNVLSRLMYPNYKDHGTYLSIPRKNEYLIPRDGLYEVYYQQGDSNFVLDQWLSKNHIITYTAGQVVRLQEVV